MSANDISNKTINNLRPDRKPYFVRYNILKGFGGRVNPTGKVVFIAKIWHDGRSVRKTLGSYPLIQATQAREAALSFMASFKSGSVEKERKKKDSVGALFNRYVAGGRLKDRKVRDYREAIFFYLSDWLNKPVASITKQMVEKRFIQIRNSQ